MSVSMDNSVIRLLYRSPSTSVSLETRSSPFLNEFLKLFPLSPVHNSESGTKFIHPVWSLVPWLLKVDPRAISRVYDVGVNIP